MDQSIRCSACGADLPPKAAFCFICGARVRSSPQATDRIAPEDQVGPGNDVPESAAIGQATTEAEVADRAGSGEGGLPEVLASYLPAIGAPAGQSGEPAEALGRSGGSVHGVNPEPSTGTEPAAQTQPMASRAKAGRPITRTEWVAGAIGAAVVLIIFLVWLANVGGGSSDNSGPAKPDLSRGLLQTDDLPAGWYVILGPEQDSSPDGANTAIGAMDVQFAESDATLLLSESVTLYRKGGASSELATERQGALSVSTPCPTCVGSSDYTSELVPLEGHGEQSFAFQEIQYVPQYPGVPRGNFTMYSEDLTIRRGDYLAAIAFSRAVPGRLPNPNAYDDSQFMERVASRADTLLAQLAGEPAQPPPTAAAIVPIAPPFEPAQSATPSPIIAGRPAPPALVVRPSATISSRAPLIVTPAAAATLPAFVVATPVPVPVAPTASGPRGKWVQVAGLGDTDCLNVRIHADVTAIVRDCLPNGAVTQIVDGPVTQNGRQWWQVPDGWLADEDLVPAAGPPAASDASPVEVVQQFYGFLGRGQYAQGFQLLSAEYQRTHAYGDWIKQFAATKSVRLDAINAGSSAGVVMVQLTVVNQTQVGDVTDRDSA